MALCLLFGCMGTENASRSGHISRITIQEASAAGRSVLRREVVRSPQGSLVFHGTEFAWYPAGQIKREAHYARGKRHGMWREWDAHGRLRTEVHYADGDLHGPFVWCDEAGNVIRDETWKNGNRIK